MSDPGYVTHIDDERFKANLEIERSPLHGTDTVQSPSGYDDGGFFAGTPQKLTHTMLRRVSTHMSFFATIVQHDRPVPIFSYGLSMALIERTLGDAGYIECPAIMPLALNSWLVIGFLNELHNTSGLAVDHEVTQRSTIICEVGLHDLGLQYFRGS
jgi:hypothetical protein